MANVDLLFSDVVLPLRRFVSSCEKSDQTNNTLRIHYCDGFERQTGTNVR